MTKPSIFQGETWKKFKNWVYYHKVLLIVVAFLAFLCVDWIGNAVKNVKNEPDWQFAYIGSVQLPQDTVEAFETAVTQYASDRNGDGKVSVSLVQYVTGYQEDITVSMAMEVQLSADLATGESDFFLLESPESFQSKFQMLAFCDGTTPEEEDFSAQGKSVLWSECPVLSNLNLGTYTDTVLGQRVSGSSDALFQDLSLGRRVNVARDELERIEGRNALWNALTEGVES